MPDPTPDTLRAAALATLRPEKSVQAALDRMGFVQADPIRAPARAQDLTLLQRVRGYKAGDLERLYPDLDAEEDMLPNYGFVTRAVQRLLHPREVGVSRIEREHPQILDEVRALLRQEAELHPREVAAQIGLGRVSNAWGGQSSATTRALDALHYRGEARVTRRLGGVRLYGPAPHLHDLRQSPKPDTERMREVVHLLAALYGPLPEASLSYLLSLSQNFGLPQYKLPHYKGGLRAAFKHAVKEELSSAKLDGVRYVWPAEWNLNENAAPRGVRIVGPFDPLVWDRRRFAHLHGWEYRFEAYTPAPKRQMGYYALPLFYGEKAVGWANLKVEGGELQSEIGYAVHVRQTKAFAKALEAELDKYRAFLMVSGKSKPPKALA